MGGKAFLRQNTTLAVSAEAATQHTISVFTHTMVAVGGSDAYQAGHTFLKQLNLRAKASVPPAAARAAHTAWWGAFWERSWIMMSAQDPRNCEAAAAVAQPADTDVQPAATDLQRAAALLGAASCCRVAASRCQRADSGGRSTACRCRGQLATADAHSDAAVLQQDAGVQARPAATGV